MSKNKKNKKLTAAEKRIKRENKAWRKKNFDIVFIGGKQKFIRKPRGAFDEEVLRNASPIWLHKNELWEYIMPNESEYDEKESIES